MATRLGELVGASRAAVRFEALRTPLLKPHALDEVEAEAAHAD